MIINIIISIIIYIMPRYKPRRYKKPKEKHNQYYKINNYSDVSHQYYDINMFNNNTGYDNTGNPIPILSSQPSIFNQMREKPYLNKPDDYSVSVVKFNLDSNSFPNQIVQPLIGLPINGNGSYQTVYTAYAWDGVGTPIIFNISWLPADATITPPTTGAQLVEPSMITNEYFWNYSYQYFLDQLNEQLFSNLIKTSTVYFKYNPTNGLITLNAGSNWYTNTGYRFYVNEQLYNLLAGFTYKYYESLPALGINTPVYQLIIQPDAGLTNIISMPNSVAVNTLVNNYIVMTQSYPSTQLWNPAVSLVFTSKTLGVVADDEMTPYIYGLNPNPSTNNSNISSNISEYILARRADPVVVYKEYLYLFKQLLSHIPQRDLTIETFWKDDYGNLHPFFLESGSNYSLKLLFRKNDFE